MSHQETLDMWTYETALKWNGDATGVEQTAGRAALPFSSPLEFGGRDDHWNPELLLVAAVEACMLLTSLSVAHRQKIPLQGYVSKAVGHMAKTGEGLRFQDIAIAVTLTIPAGTDPAKAEQVVRTAEKYCPVSNALKCPITLSVTVQTV